MKSSSLFVLGFIKWQKFLRFAVKDCYLLRIREEIRDEIQFVRESAKQRSRSIPFHSIWGWGESSHPHLLMWWVFKSLSLCVSVCVFARSRFFARSFLASESPEESWRGEDEENEQCDVLDEIYSMTDWLPYIVLGIEITFVPHSISRRNVVQYCLQGARRPSATIASLSLAYS